MTESFAQLFEESLNTVHLKQGELIRGEVVHVDDEVVIVNAGLKSEGVIPADQFRDARGELTVKVGDYVEVVIEDVADKTGETKLSREKAQRVKAWERSREGVRRPVDCNRHHDRQGQGRLHHRH